MTAPRGPQLPLPLPPGYTSCMEMELNLGHFCNNRCVFCVSGQLTERGLADQAPLDRMRAKIRTAAGQGVKKLTLLGGEPTLHPDFLEVLEEIRQYPFEEVVIFSNGARARDTAFLEEACQKGRFTWRFSIQGGNAERHDHTTGRKGAFARIEAGLQTLQRLQQRVTVNCCVNGVNREELEELPAFLSRYGVRQLHADMVRPHSVGDRGTEEMDALVVPYPLILPHLRSLLQNALLHAPELEVTLGNLPFCLLPEAAPFIVHGTPPTRTITADASGKSLQADQEKQAYQAEERSYVEVCRSCSARPRCSGIPHAYLHRYGPSEFHPLPPGPPSHLSGTLLLTEALAALAGAPPPAPAERRLLQTLLPPTGEGLKYDAYFSTGGGRGFTINSRWEGEAAIPRFEGYIRSQGRGYAIERLRPFWAAAGGVLTLGVGWDRPGALPRMKLYAQEDRWGSGILSRKEAERISGERLPSFVGERVDVLCMELHPGGEVSWKAYVGGPDPQSLTVGGPPELRGLAAEMAGACPEDGWYYLTIRLGNVPRFAINKIYGPTEERRSWSDVAALFRHARQEKALEKLLLLLRSRKELKVWPTATALQKEGVDLYLGARLR